jgi:Lectin C-type domain
VIGSPFENQTGNLTEWSGAVSLVATARTPHVMLAKAVERLQSDLGGTLEERTFFGSAVTGPRISRALGDARDQFDLTLFSGSGLPPPPPSVLFPSGDLGDGAPWLPLGLQTTVNTALFSRGQSSLEVRGTGVLTSPLFNPSALSAVGSLLKLDVYIPETAPATLTGSIEVHLTVPKALLLNALVGRVELSDLHHGIWVHASFPLNDVVRAALYQNDPLAFVALAVALPTGQSILLDDLRSAGHLQAAPNALCALAVYGGHDYFDCAQPKTWSTARTLCQGVGMDLAVLGTQPEDAFFTRRFLLRHFVGATDAASEGIWLWSPSAQTFWSGGPLGHAATGAYANWGLLQPSTGFLVDLDCGTKNPLGLLGKWEARSCGESNAFLCETK